MRDEKTMINQIDREYHDKSSDPKQVYYVVREAKKIMWFNDITHQVI